jgi:hypothetical protein
MDQSIFNLRDKSWIAPQEAFGSHYQDSGGSDDHETSS